MLFSDPGGERKVALWLESAAASSVEPQAIDFVTRRWRRAGASVHLMIINTVSFAPIDRERERGE